MSAKRSPSPDFVENPFIKKRNLEWTLDLSSPLPTSISSNQKTEESKKEHSIADIEAGEAKVKNHLTHFTSHLSKYIISNTSSTTPTISISSFRDLYQSNSDSLQGSHFVIHQHNHPIAGTHYDLRLQINETSSASWAIMYGLPGDANSTRLNRNATETRIHCLWNHLIEAASSATGSLLIYDTGTYTILPRRSKHAVAEDPSSPLESQASSSPSSHKSQQQLLHEAFQNRKIRLRLHGAKLPDPYIVNLRVTKKEDIAARAKNTSSHNLRRKPQRRNKKMAPAKEQQETTDEEDTDEERLKGDQVEDDAHIIPPSQEPPPDKELSAVEKEIQEIEDTLVRTTNAYPGATNSIGSVHQRKWYLSLDRAACGFVERKRRSSKKRWEYSQEEDEGVDNDKRPEQLERGERLHWPFYVGGPEYETSIVTGRKSEHVLRDEGVVGFVPRKGWAPVLM